MAGVLMPLLSEADEERLSEAIASAHHGNAGTIAVQIDEDPWGDVDQRAIEIWESEALHTTPASVLVHVGVADRAVRVLASAELEAAAGREAWDAVATRVAAGFKRGDPVAGLLTGLARVGELLREHAAPGEE